MDDTIYRQAAIDGKFTTQLANGVEIYPAEAVLVEYLKALPSAEPERKTGRWELGAFERIGGYWATCSACGSISFGGGKYCRDCGADMRTPTQVQLDEADGVMMGGDNGKTD